MCRVVESEEERDYLNGKYTREGQAEKQGLYRRKGADKVLTTYTQYARAWIGI